jgi:hypothetical protein
MKLLKKSELPAGVSYPGEFIRTVGRGIVHLEPWWIIEGAVLREKLNGLRKRYPNRVLIPFAQRQDNDDVACFEGNAQGSVVVIHDYASIGWEQRKVFANFYAWLRQAVEDMIEWDAMEE